MGKTEQLEKQIKLLEKQIKQEIEQTETNKKEMEELIEAVAQLKQVLKFSGERPSVPIVMEGWLEKKGAIRHNWLKRWFVLESKKALVYYEKKGVSIFYNAYKISEIIFKDVEPLGVIPLTNATCYASVEKNKVIKPLFLNIRTENRDFLVRAESKELKVNQN